MENIQYQTSLKKLLKHPTTAIPQAEVNKLHELLYHKAIIPLFTNEQGYTILRLGNRKGSKTKIKYFLKYGTVRTA